MVSADCGTFLTQHHAQPNFSSPANIDASVEWRNQPDKYKERAKALALKAQANFAEAHSDVFIPHPDTNPGERLLAKDDDEKKIATVEVWDSDSGEQDEWGSDMSQSGSDNEG